MIKKNMKKDVKKMRTKGWRTSEEKFPQKNQSTQAPQNRV